MTDPLQSDESDAAALVCNSPPSIPDPALLMSPLSRVRSIWKIKARHRNQRNASDSQTLDPK